MTTENSISEKNKIQTLNKPNTSLPEKLHRRRHVQDKVRPKKTKNRTCKHAKDAIDAKQ